MGYPLVPWEKNLEYMRNPFEEKLLEYCVKGIGTIIDRIGKNFDVINDKTGGILKKLDAYDRIALNSISDTIH